MEKTSRKRWIWWLIGVSATVVTLSYTLFTSYNMNYSYLDLESIQTDRVETDSIGPESSVEVTFDQSTFHELVNDIKKNHILSIKGWHQEVGPDHFFVRGYQRFQKPFLLRLLSKFNFWYVVFDIEYQSNRVYIQYEWYDGDNQGPVTIQDHTAKPSDIVSSKGPAIHSQIVHMIEQFKTP